MLNIRVTNETARLEAVVLGTAQSSGPSPAPEDCYDPKSLEYAKAGTYPVESDMVAEMDAFEAILKRHNVLVYRPTVLDNVNQIFTRDIAFCIDDQFFIANIIDQRAEEFEAINHVLDLIDEGDISDIPDDIQIEGGDVMLLGDNLFVGTYLDDDFDDYMCCRTSPLAVDYLQAHFPHKTVRGFDLVKSNEPRTANALHLDCCFQPIGKNGAILCPYGFKDTTDISFIEELYGLENIFRITAEQMYDMQANVFSIAENIVVSDKRFLDLNSWMRNRGIVVEEIDYSQISKQGGMLRCSTLPLSRVS